MKTMAMRREVQSQAGRSATAPAAHAASAPILNTGVLFAGGSEVIIAHGQDIYRLRLTRQNRLILTK